MKITIISSYGPRTLGGLGTFTRDLIFELKKHAKVKSIYQINNEDTENTILQKLIFSLNCIRKLSKDRPDIIYAYGGWYISQPIVIYKKIFPSVKIAYIHHTDPDYRLKGIKKLTFECILSQFDINIFVSKYLKRRLSYYNITSDKYIINSGISINNAKPSDINKYKSKFNLDNITLSYINNFKWQRKSEGAITLIKSIPIVLKKHNVKLIIIGNGPYRMKAEDIVKKLKLTKNVLFVGEVANSIIALASSDIFIHITYQDAFPIVILEAMAQKKPVIVSQGYASNEIIKDGFNGLLTKNYPSAIASKIISLIENKNIASILASNGYATANNYKWAYIIKKYLNLFK